jgi:hypothetical protein
MPPLADTNSQPEDVHSAICAFTSPLSDFELACITILDIWYSTAAILRVCKRLKEVSCE